MIFPSIAASDVIDGDLTCIASYNPSERKLYLIDTLKDWALKEIMPKQAKIWKRQRLTNDNDYDIYEYYANITAIFRLNQSTSDSSVLKAIEYLIQGGVPM